MLFEIVKVVALFIGATVTVGGVVFGTVMFVRKSEDKARVDARQYTDNLLASLDQRRSVEHNHTLERLEQRHNIEREAIMTQFNSLLDLSKNDVKLTFCRLNDIDVWRKEINGQLRLLGQQSEFTNKILEGQGKHLEALTTVNQQMSISIAEIKTTLDAERALRET